MINCKSPCLGRVDEARGSKLGNPGKSASRLTTALDAYQGTVKSEP